MSEGDGKVRKPARKLRANHDPLSTEPTPMGGASKQKIDLALSAIKAGSSVVSLMSGLLAAVLILYSGYVLYDSFSTSYGAYKSSWDLLQYKPEIVDEGANPSAGADALAEINKDYRGWLTVYNSNIDYPVVQGENDLYYASHDIYGNVSLTGAIYLAAGNKGDGSDSYNVIYGHHMDNGAMFGQLDSFRNQSFYDSHREGIWVTESGAYDLYAFAVVSTDAYESRIYTTGNRAADVRAFLEGDRSGDVGLGTKVLIYDQETARKADRILALSTCADAETNGRLVVFLRMIPRSLPTPTPEPVKVKLKIRYVYEDGTEAFETKEYIYNVGEGYSHRSPRLEGYTADLLIVEGTIEKDTEITVTYRRQYRLRIRYVFLTGETAAETYVTTLHAGDEYDRENPVIEGYTTARERIKGTMEAMDTEITVIYIPLEIAELGDTASIDDYEVPLGLDNLHAQMGVCVE